MEHSLHSPSLESLGLQPKRLLVLVDKLGAGIILAVGDDLGHIDDLQEAAFLAFLRASGLAAVLGIGGSALLSWAFLRRVDAISRSTEAIIGGDFVGRLPRTARVMKSDRLAGTFSRILDRIVVLTNRLHRSGNDLAHDLRTPLARLYLRLEEARSHVMSPAKRETAFDAALVDVEGLLEMFSTLLRITEVEAALPLTEFRGVDLSVVVRSVTEAYRLDAEGSGHQLITIISPQLKVSGDPDLLAQALANLLENALRHTPSGTRIRVHLSGSFRRRVLLSVEDDGPGVAAADLSRLTDRFYRAERSRTTAGNGLGLSLVSAIAELHGAKLSVHTTNPGLRVSLQFPASSQMPRW